LKFLPCSDDTSAAKEIRAIQYIRQLQHPHLTPIEQVWCQRGYVVVAMPLADGSLLDLLEVSQVEFETPIPPDQVCFYLGQAAEALDFLNTRQHVMDGASIAIQHCDVKPSNMLLFGETVKLCDFGLSSLTISPLQAHRKAGTRDYSAPEVFQGRISDWT